MALSTMSAAAQTPTVPREKLNVIKEFLDTKLTRETISDLHVHLKTLIKDWYEVGLSLKVPIEMLDEIDVNKPEVSRKVVAMVVKWIDNMETPTWRALFDALSRNGHLQVVKSILNNIKFFKKDEAVDQRLVEYVLKDVKYHQMDLDMASLVMENIQVPHITNTTAKKAGQQITQRCQNICQILKVTSNDKDVRILLEKAHIEGLVGENLTLDQLRKVTCEVKVLSQITKEKAEMLEKHADVLQTTLEELSLIKKKIIDIKCDLENKLRKLSDIKSELSRLKSTDKSNELLLRMEENEQELLQTKQYLQRSMDILDNITSKNELLTRELNKSLQHTQNAKIQSQKVSDFANSCYKTSKSVHYEARLFQNICLFIVYVVVLLSTNQYWLMKILLHVLGHVIAFRMIETAPEIIRKIYAPVYICILAQISFAQVSIYFIWSIAILATRSIANLMKWTNFESLDNGGVFGTILTALIEPFLSTNSKTISVVLPIILTLLITAQTILHKCFPRKFPTAIINIDTASLGFLSPAIWSWIGNYFGDYLKSENNFIIACAITCWILVRLHMSMKQTMIGTGILVLLLGISSNPTNDLIFVGYIFVLVAVIAPIHQWFCVSYGSPSSQLERSTFECIEWLTVSLAILDNTEQIITRLKYELQHL